MSIDAEALGASLQRLARTDPDTDVLATLRQVTRACADIFTISGCGIMISDEQNVPHYVAASDETGRILEKAESETRQGPCTEAYVKDQVVASSDLRTDQRWPELAVAMADQDVRAVLGVPLRLAGAVVGTLDVYLDRPHDWDDLERAALCRYGAVIEAVLASAMAAHTAGELASQLQYALDYRISIERGIGYLMASERLDAVEAFNRLRQAARSTRTKIGSVADELLRTGRLPERGPTR